MNNITLNTKLYAWRGYLGKIAQWVYGSTGVPTAANPLTASVDVPADITDPNASYRVKWKLKMPTTQAEATECACPGTVLRNQILDIVFTASASGTTAERQEMLDQLDDLVADTQFRNSFLNLSLGA